MTDVVLYARLSVTTEESVSIDRQLRAGRKYAEARGWTVVGEFKDDGVSASKVRPDLRPGWRELLTFVADHDVHAAIVWKVDRLARRVLDFLNADAALQEHHAGLVAVEDPIDMTTPQGRAFATVLAVFAELEAASIAARVKGARKALLDAGRRGGGRPPYGWMNADNPDGPGKVLVQDPERIGFVSEAAARALRGDSLYSITTWLTESGAPLRPSKRRLHDRWAEASVESILRNPVLAGLTPYSPNRKPGETPDPWAVVRDQDGVMVADESVAVLTIAERRELLDVLDAAKRPGSRPQQGKRPTLLSTLLRCGTCGSVMHRSTSGGGYDGYRCANRECTRQASVNRQRAEEFVIERALDERGDEPDWEWTEHRQDTAALTAITQALADAGAELVATRDPAEQAKVLARIASLQARQDEEAAVPVLAKVIVTPASNLSWGERLTAALDAGDTVEAARLLREQVTEVTIRPTGRNAHTPLADRAEVAFTDLDVAA